jgi:hypothetical protein
VVIGIGRQLDRVASRRRDDANIVRPLVFGDVEDAAAVGRPHRLHPVAGLFVADEPGLERREVENPETALLIGE